jgi:hypothetical protein
MGYYSIKPADLMSSGWDTIVSGWDSTATKQYGVRELLFVISYKIFFGIIEDFQDVCYLALMGKRQKLRYK